MSSPIIAEPTSIGLYLTQNGAIVSNDEYGYWKLRTHELAWNDPVADLKEQHYDTDVWEDFFEEHLHYQSLPLVEVTPEMIALACCQVIAENKESCVDDFIEYPFSNEQVFKQLVHDFLTKQNQDTRVLAETRHNRFYTEPVELGLYLTQDGRIVAKYTESDGCHVWKFNTSTLTSDDILQDVMSMNKRDGYFWASFVDNIGKQALPLVEITPEMIANACLEDVRLRKLFSLAEYADTPVDDHEVFRTLIRMFLADKER